ncbi:MAG: penicillin-binding protein 2 [Parachlamydiales bacterium]|nr:penicillin-binding protein 2 [Parachlamydiales bacterium]
MKFIFKDKNDDKRILVVAVGMLAFFALLIAQFYKLQIVEGDRWLKEAISQQEKVVVEPFKRGVFYSNTSIRKAHHDTPQAFVVDVEKFHLYVDPFHIPENQRTEVAKKIYQIASLPKDDYAHFRHEFDRKSRSRKLAMWLDDETKNEILNWWLPYAKRHKIPRNAIFFVTDFQRSYPYGKSLGQVLHTIRDNKDEVTKQGFPTGGLELQFNEYLKGKQGKRLLMHSPRNPLEKGSIIEAPENGADVYLTINHFLQAIAEEEIAKGVKKAKAKGGWALMLDPHTGEVLALAQYPFFSLSNYSDYFNDVNEMEHTRAKAIIDAHEIGSIMKPITLAIGFKANEECLKRGKPPIFDPNEKLATSNGQFPGRSKPIRDTRLHHYLNMNLALQKSSNIYFARMVDRIIKSLGNEWYRDALQSVFGFGLKTKIELPGEMSGLLPRPGKKHPNGTLEWSVPTPYSLAFGHNILATSLQVATAYSVLANGGIAIKPTLVRKIVKTKSDGSVEVLLDNTTEERVKNFPRVLSKPIVQEVVRAMKLVTKPGGTAPEADIPGYTEAGKTGTAEKIVGGVYSKSHYFSSFVGFAPVSEPLFVLIVSIDEPLVGFVPGVGKIHHGGHCAAPVFKEISKKTLEYLGIPPDDPYGYPVGDPRRDSEKADCMQEIKRLKALYEAWNLSPNK